MMAEGGEVRPRPENDDVVVPLGEVWNRDCPACHGAVSAPLGELDAAMAAHVVGCRMAIIQAQAAEMVALVRLPWWQLGGYRFKRRQRRQRQMRAAAGMGF